MRLRPSRPGFHTLTGASIALALALCASPSRVEAGCSHYAVAANHPMPLTSRLDILNLGGTSDTPLDLPTRPAPCSGALCSGKPAVPPMPVSISAVRSSEADVHRKIDPPAPCADGRFLAYVSPIARAVIEGPSIERPPR